MDFFASAPKVSESEFRKTLSALRSRGFSEYDVNDIDELFKEALGGYERGLSRKSIGRGIKWLRQNKSKHHLSEEQVVILEEELMNKL